MTLISRIFGFLIALIGIGVRVVDPERLLLVANDLLVGGIGPPLSDAHLRRAVSTAYYALFHTVLRAGAGRFFGSGEIGRAGYAAVYRGFSHGRIKTVCGILAASRRQQTRTTMIGQDVRDFASSFLELQDARLSADYDPAAVFVPHAVLDFIAVAQKAISAFHSIPAAEQADILALMLVNPRP